MPAARITTNITRYGNAGLTAEFKEPNMERACDVIVSMYRIFYATGHKMSDHGHSQSWDMAHASYQATGCCDIGIICNHTRWQYQIICINNNV